MKKVSENAREQQEGLSAYTLPFYTSRAWKNCRNAYYKSKGGLCERCAKQGKIVPGYEVHHKVKLDRKTVNDPSIALSWDNLELLCIKCHHGEHRKHKRRYEFTEDGRVIAPLGRE